MRKVMIVDDEPTIREGLRTLISWERLGYRVVDTAANAREALVKFADHLPDLMMVDIRMPGMDGLQLVQEIRKDNSEVRILILSGYADFSYAKKAIGLGIEGYLLKPVDEEELEDYLKKLNGEFERELEARKRSAAMDGWNRDKLIQSVLTESFGSENGSLEAAAEGAGLLWNNYQVVLVKLSEQAEGDTGTAAAVKWKLSNLFDETGGGGVFSAEPYLGILLKESIHNDSVRKAVYKDIAEAAASNGFEFVVSAGDKVGRFEHIVSSYASALDRMKQQFFYEEESIIGPHSQRLQIPNKSGHTEETANLEAAADNLYYALDIGSVEPLSALVAEAGRLMLQAGYNENAIKSGFVRILSQALNKLSLNHREIAARLEQNSAAVQHIYNHSPYAALLRYIIRFLEEIVGQLGSAGTDVQMKKMIDLINRHYHENLKLESLAEVFNYNSAYLGKLFKNTTGESFNTYLDKVRIEKAKQLLEQGMKVYEVAEKVGFTNVDYFHSKFKKYVGSSPSGYRKK
jgi:two-component system response regulator YesN